MSSNKKGLLVVGVAGLASLAFMVGIVFLANGQGRPARPDVTLSAFELRRAYHTNPLGADEKFKGKTLQVSGVVQSRERGLGYLALDGVECTFDPKHKDEIESARIGNGITVVGQCQGSPHGMVVILTQCRVAPQ